MLRTKEDHSGQKYSEEPDSPTFREAFGTGTVLGCGLGLVILLLGFLWFISFLWTAGVFHGLFYLSLAALFLGGLALVGQGYAPAGGICIFVSSLAIWWILGPGHGYEILALISGALLVVSLVGSIIPESVKDALGGLVTLAMGVAVVLFIYLVLWLPIERDVEGFFRAVSHWWQDIVNEQRSR